jgi:hypothetical protein
MFARSKRTIRSNRAFLEMLESRRLLANAVFEITNDNDPEMEEASGIYGATFKINNTGDLGDIVAWQIDLGEGGVSPEDFTSAYFNEEGTVITQDAVYVAAGSWTLIYVSVANDIVVEPTESFAVRLIAASGTAQYGEQWANKDIKDDDVKMEVLGGGSTGIPVTVGDYEIQKLRTLDYYGSPVANVAVYLSQYGGNVNPVWAHDVSDAQGIVEFEMGGYGMTPGWTTVVPKYDSGGAFRGPQFTFTNEPKRPQILWKPSVVQSEGKVKAPWNSNVLITAEFYKYDGSRLVQQTSFPVEWGMNHSSYAERQGDINGADANAINANAINAKANAWVTGRFYSALADTDKYNYSGTSLGWVKQPWSGKFHYADVVAEIPIVTFGVSATNLRTATGGMAVITVHAQTSQGLPVQGLGAAGKVISEANESYLGFGASTTNQINAGSWTDNNGNLTFNTSIQTWHGGSPATATARFYVPGFDTSDSPDPNDWLYREVTFTV